MPRPRQSEPAPTRHAISSFTRVSKGLANKEAKPSGRKRKAVAFEDENADPAAATTLTRASSKRHKRGKEEEEEAQEKEEEENRTPKTPLKWPACSSSKPGRRATLNDGIAKAKQQNREALSRRAFDAAQAKKDAKAKLARTKNIKNDDDDNGDNDDNEDNGIQVQDLPSAIAELVDMHAALLRTLTMHLAHAARAAPIDLRALAPDVARAWGKRSLTILDVRRCLALQAIGGAAPFVLADYGRGKICIERGEVDIHEEELQRQFIKNLLAVCAEKMDNISLNNIPQAPIAQKAIAVADNPLLAKGHQALVSLKNGLATKAAEDAAAEAASAAAAVSKLSLLDRIRLRSLARSSGPAPPTAAEIDRRTALQRIADVANVVSSLSLLRPVPRQAFPMAMLVERLRDSLRVPISSDEAARCVRVLAGEVAPGWVTVVKVGGSEQVVVQRGLQPVDRVIRERVAAMV